MRGELESISAHTVEKGGIASTSERKAEHVHAGTVHDPTVVPDRAVMIEETRLEPRVARAEAGRPDHGVDRAEVEGGRGLAERRRRRSVGSRERVLEGGLLDV